MRIYFTFTVALPLEDGDIPQAMSSLQEELSDPTGETYKLLHDATEWQMELRAEEDGK